MTFAFTGFFQDGAYRVFSFEVLPRTPIAGTFWVRADMNLVRKHKIQMQELPLLCRAVLENHEGGEHTVTYTASEMTLHANARASAEEIRKARKPQPPRRATA